MVVVVMVNVVSDYYQLLAQVYSEGARNLHCAGLLAALLPTVTVLANLLAPVDESFSGCREWFFQILFEGLGLALLSDNLNCNICHGCGCGCWFAAKCFSSRDFKVFGGVEV